MTFGNTDARLELPYLPKMSGGQYRDLLRSQFGWLEVLIGNERFIRHLEKPLATENEFELDGDISRGGSYREAMRVTAVRSRGMNALLEMASPRGLPVASRPIVLDVLGGDGELARVSEVSRPELRVITSDVAGHMVESALGAGRAAIRQISHSLLISDESVDSVVIAYGTHHILPEFRASTMHEAYRVLKPGGRLVIHDFEPSGEMSSWFREIVDVYASGGHPYDHLGRRDLQTLLSLDRWKSSGTLSIVDPFIANAATPDAASAKLIGYLRRMYGLRSVGVGGLDDAQLEFQVTRIFSQREARNGAGESAPLRPYRQKDGTFSAAVFRDAAVGFAEK